MVRTLRDAKQRTLTSVLQVNHGLPSFLPLSPAFNYTSTESWQDLLQDIQDWIVTVSAKNEPQSREWGLELFWIAFVASHPEFPSGQWPTWDNRIPLQGQFIAKWLSGAVKVGEELEGLLPSSGGALSARMVLWDLFRTKVSSCFPSVP